MTGRLPKLILASASPQRRKLLELTGLPFTVRPSGVEEKCELKGGAAALVKHNALIKARDVAAKVKTGLVIGADTVVSADGKIIGKPKDLADARRILAVLSRRPQWVYTGVALIDAAGGKTVAGYEKTRIFMDPLTGDEMKSYHRRVPPLDKAGGFDIEGVGGLFIRRIEGCYTNVIGLPMAKLRKMLKKFGVWVL